MASTRDTRTVMIVDSEPAQQRFLSALVSRGGWRSIVAGDTDTALAKLGTQEGMALDAVLVDQGTPGMDIAEFVAELRRWRPALPLIVIGAVGMLVCGPLMLRWFIASMRERGR